MVVGGLALLAITRPWRPDPEGETVTEAVQDCAVPRPRPKRPCPRPAKSRSMSHLSKRHRVEVISRTRRVPSEPGREEILLPEWLGPVTGPR